MPDIVYFAASSLDGYIADRDGSLDWLTSIAAEGVTLTADFMATVGVQVMGSSTYEWLLESEDLLAQPDKWRAFYGSLPTVVFSSRALPVPAGADIELVDGPVADHGESLRTKAGAGDVWVVGGGVLARQFLDAGLLDRVEITYAPVLLGDGVPLCGPGAPVFTLAVVRATVHGPFTHLVLEVPRA